MASKLQFGIGFVSDLIHQVVFIFYVLFLYKVPRACWASNKNLQGKELGVEFYQQVHKKLGISPKTLAPRGEDVSRRKQKAAETGELSPSFWRALG
jgi:hypothetical protein